jgi:hypothetical protein
VCFAGVYMDWTPAVVANQPTVDLMHHAQMPALLAQ